MCLFNIYVMLHGVLLAMGPIGMIVSLVLIQEGKFIVVNVDVILGRILILDILNIQIWIIVFFLVLVALRLASIMVILLLKLVSVNVRPIHQHFIQ